MCIVTLYTLTSHIYIIYVHIKVNLKLGSYLIYPGCKYGSSTYVPILDLVIII